MKYTTFIGTEHEEEVLIYAKEKTSLVIEIERIIESNNKTISASNEDEKIVLNPMEVDCFVSDNNKVFAIKDDSKFQVKERIYQLEEKLKESFIKINQSCLANIKRIDRFKTSIGGSVIVIFENGYSEYISRRELKNVKERLGI